MVDRNIRRKFLKAVLGAVLSEGGSEEDLRLLLDDPEKCNRVALEIIDRARGKAYASFRGSLAWRSSVPIKSRVLVEYRQPPFIELWKSFEVVWESYRDVKFKRIERCKDVSIETRELDFKLVEMEKGAPTRTILAETVRLGLRPALYEEFLAFIGENRDLQRDFPMAALGSVCELGDGIYSPSVNWWDIAGFSGNWDMRRKLTLSHYPWQDNHHFLAVRE